jgi:hypothetical protein
MLLSNGNKMASNYVLKQKTPPSKRDVFLPVYMMRDEPPNNDEKTPERCKHIK